MCQHLIAVDVSAGGIPQDKELLYFILPRTDSLKGW